MNDEAAPPRSAYITPEGARALREELQTLWRVTRPEVTAKVKEAAALGDRSENAEYIYGKRQLREIDRRVRFLRKRLDELTVVAHLPEDRTRVFFGAWVTLADADADAGANGAALVVRLVGSDELDPARNHVSIDAPLARALLGHRVGDTARVRTPEGTMRWRIEAIDYCDLTKGH